MNDLTERVGTVLFNRGAFVPILPFEYGDSLSYLEEVGHLVAKVNEVVNAINNITANILDEAKAYTDSEIQLVKGYVDEAVENVNQTVELLNERYAGFVELVNANLSVMDNRLDDQDLRIESATQEAHSYTNTAIEQNNDYIINHISEYLSEIKVLNPFTGERVSVQDMIDYLAQFHFDNAITAGELRDANITATAFTNLHMTASQYVINGKTIIEG